MKLLHPIEKGRPSELERRQGLHFAVRDGLFYSMMTGFGESYLGAFSIFLKATNPQIALIASAPQFLAALFQLVSVKLLNHIRSRKTIILAGVIGQALTWILILSIPFIFKRHPIPWLIAAITSYFVLGGFANPAWNSLMGDLVDSRRRGRYFGRRNRLMSVATFASLCLAGVILHEAEKRGKVAFGFTLLFSFSLIVRLISASYIARMVEPRYDHRDEDHFSLWQFVQGGRKTNFGRFVVYISLIHFSVYVSGPFIAPYLLRDLQFTYLQFMYASAATVMAQFLTLHLWGRFGDRFGNKKALAVTGLLLPIIPLFWLFTTNFYLILVIQMFGGLCWAGFSLSMGNFVFDTVSPPKRAQCVAIYNLSIAIGIFLGASLGGFLSRWLPEEIYLGAVHFTLVSNLQLLFLLSAVFRFVVSLKFLPTIREAREVRPFIAKDLFIVIGQMWPLSGVRFNLSVFARKKKMEGVEGDREPRRAAPAVVGGEKE